MRSVREAPGRWLVTALAAAVVTGCGGSAGVDGSDRAGPTLAGLWGSQVELDDGTTAVVDRADVARSVRDPAVEVRDGYAGSMPVYDLSPEEIGALVAYLQTLEAR